MMARRTMPTERGTRIFGPPYGWNRRERKDRREKMFSAISAISAVSSDRLAPAATAARRLRRLSRIRAVGRRAGPGRAEEQLLAVRVGHVAPVGAEQRMVARLVAVDDELRADLQRLARDAAAEQRVRRAAFHHPLFLRA